LLQHLILSAPCGFAGQKTKQFRGHRCLFGNSHSFIFGGLIRADCTSLIDLLADKELALSVGSAANG